MKPADIIIIAIVAVLCAFCIWRVLKKPTCCGDCEKCKNKQKHHK